MTTFDEREKAFESKFAHDADLKFLVESRRNKTLAEWAAGKLGMHGTALEDYIRAMRKTVLAKPANDTLFKTVKADFAAKGVLVSDADLRSQMQMLLAKALHDIESGTV